MLGFLNPYLTWIKLACAAALAGALFFGGWHVRGWKDEAAQTAAVEAAVALRAKEDEANYSAALAAAQKVEKVRYVTRTITKTVDRWRDRPVARNVCLDADGLRIANDALRGSAAASGPVAVAPVPAAQ